MSDFHKFATAIKARFDQMSKYELFVVGEDRDAVWANYLASFPEGTNPIFRKRTEYDCGCCRHFVRNIGNAVAIVNGEVQSIWNVKGLEYPFDVVAKSMDKMIKALPITELFRMSERAYGAEQSFERLEDGSAKKWDHFYATISDRHFSCQVAKDRGEYAAAVQVFRRGFEEIKPEALQTVLELIESNALYRGAEFAGVVEGFQGLQEAYVAGTDFNTFLWDQAFRPQARIRNTVIGTLLQDLSAGVGLEEAVRSFEAKVAPTNYKRPTALITPAMIKAATKAIADMGLESALERRFAKLSDISVNNVLWVDNSVAGKMRDGIESLLLGAVKTKPVEDKARQIGIEEFMKSIAPQASGMELFVKNAQASNFMSLTAPVHADSGKLFKWNNDFGWSYDGNITDSIKEKVKRAGGDVDAKLRVSLAWFNFDDLDIHVYEPNGTHICFRNKLGKLDVDMNAGSGQSREPVENVSWKTPADGTYKVVIDQYIQRETSNPGFVVEVENNGQVHQLSYDKAVRGDVLACHLVVRAGQVVELKPGPDLVGGGISQEKWGIKTESYAKVNTLMASPNHWDGNATGNKHWFFILDKCLNDQAARGIYNEFLHPSLDVHRKVFEVLGDKTKCQPVAEQLSGLGFSSTRADTVMARVTGDKVGGTYSITF